MKIRTIEVLFDQTDGELAWRRAEMQALGAQLTAGDDPRARGGRRAAVTIAYAHWEGGTLALLRLLLDYVRSLNLKLSELSDHYVALACRNRLLVAQQSKQRISPHVALVQSLRADDQTAWLPQSKVLSGGANLSSKVLRDLADSVGLSMAPFELQSRFIDVNLVERRNHIAHGEYYPVDLEDAREALKRVIQLLMVLRTEVQNHAQQEGFRRNQVIRP